MSRVGYWAPVLAGAVLLATAIAIRFRGLPIRDHSTFLSALSLFAAGMIIGPLPWALDWGTGAFRSSVSILSILATVSAVVLMVRWRSGATQRHDA